MSPDPQEALRHIGRILSECLMANKKPTQDQMMAMLSWALAGQGKLGGRE